MHARRLTNYYSLITFLVGAACLQAEQARSGQVVAVVFLVVFYGNATEGDSTWGEPCHRASLLLAAADVGAPCVALAAAAGLLTTELLACAAEFLLDGLAELAPIESRHAAPTFRVHVSTSADVSISSHAHFTLAREVRSNRG